MLGQIYKNLSKNVKIKNNFSLEKLVNFSNNLNEPIHRWFNIKEGYSRNLVEIFINRFSLKENDIMMDPFTGSGTTLLTAKEKNINAIGFEINPFLSYVAKNKLINLNNAELKKIQKFLKILKISRKKNLKLIPKLSISNKLFMENIAEITNLRKQILHIKTKKVKDLLFLGYLSILEDCSTAKKDGNGLKYKKKFIQPNVKKIFEKKINQILEDINSIKPNNSYQLVINDDVRNLNNHINKNIKLKKIKNNVSLIIFSPPYMNCFDYSEVYKIELWFGKFINEYSDLKKLRSNSLRSHLNTHIEINESNFDKYILDIVNHIKSKKLWSNKIPLMILGFFADMEQTMNGLYKMLKKDGSCVIVVGNSAYGNVAIPTDLILSNIALKIGFKNCQIEIARHLGTSSQQHKSVKFRKLLRESVIILKK